MANAFDQFDTEQQELNVFDQFDQGETAIQDHPAQTDQQYSMTPEEIQAQRESQERGPTVNKEYSPIDKAIGAVETGLSMLTGSTTGAAAGIPAGLAGAVGDLLGMMTPEEAQSFQEEAMSRFTYEPRSEAGQEYIGEIGEVLGTLPPVMGAAMPARPRTVKGAAKQIAKEEKSFKKKGFRSAMGAKSPEDLQGILGKGDEANIATSAKIDPAIEQAAARLGMKEEGLLSNKATDPSFIASEQMLKSVPGSKLQMMEDAYVAELNVKADDLINTLGSTDKSAIDYQIFNRSRDAIDNLGKVAEKEYQALSDKIDPKAIAEMNESRSYIQNIVDDLGGDTSSLTPLEKRVMNMAERENITYTAVDRLRKQVGAALGKESDVFKTETRNSLSKIYDALTQDQEAVAPELGADWARAKASITKRKALEEQATIAFGKKLSDSFIPKLGSSLKQLSKGKQQDFNKLISSIDKRDRPKAIATALADVFQGSSQQPQMTPAAFDSWYRNITRNGVKRNLYKYLPGEFTKTLDDIAKVTEGVRRAKTKEITTGRLLANPGIGGKAVNLAINSAIAKLGGVFTEGAKIIADSAGKRPETEALKVLTNPDFIRAATAIAEGNAKKAQAYERKVKATKSGKQVLGKLGVLGFLNSFELIDQQPEDKDQDQKK